MRRLLKGFVWCLLSAVVGAAVVVVLHATTMSAGGGDISYSDFLAVTLTGLSLMVTILGFFVAALGVVGWQTIENKLKSHSDEYFATQLARDGPLRRELEELFTEIAYSGIENLRSQKQEEGSYTD